MSFKIKLSRQERAAVKLFASIGGRSKSKKKADAARENGKKHKAKHEK